MLAVGCSWCSYEDDALAITAIKTRPDPPSIGKSLAIRVSGTLKRDVGDSAHVDVHLYDGIFKVKIVAVKRCSRIGVSCPIRAGIVAFETTFDVPQNMPAGLTMEVEAVATNGDGSSRACTKSPVRSTG